MTLLKNLTNNPQSIGPYSFDINHWGFIPSDISASWGLERDPRFFSAPKGNPQKDKWDIVLFSGCPLGTTGGGQHPPQIARALAQEGHRVLFIQVVPQSSTDPNIMVLGDGKFFRVSPPNKTEIEFYEDIFFDFNDSRSDKKLALFTFPSEYMTGLINVASSANYKTCYWCLDDWPSINKAAGNLRFKEETEFKMIHRADYLVATADILGGKLQRVSGRHCKVIPNGFSRDNFPKVEHRAPVPADMKIGETTLVYWGELQGKWMDWDLIQQVAHNNPDWQINLIGPNKQISNPPKLANIHYLGEKPVTELRFYGAHADIGIIPFKPGEISNAVNPIKAYEYLACGLWVLGPNLPELKKFPKTRIYANYQQFMEHVVRMRQERLRDALSVSSFLRKSTWNHRAKALLEYAK